MSDYYDVDEIDEIDRECVDALVESALLLTTNDGLEWLALVPRENGGAEIDIWIKDSGSPQGILLDKSQLSYLASALQAVVDGDI